MATELTDWKKQGCAENGGTEDLYVYNIDDRESYTLENGVVTAITLKAGTTAVRWQPDMESGMFTNNGNRSRENNSYYIGQTGMVIFKDDMDATAEIVDQVSRGFVCVIAKQAMPNGETRFRHYGLLNALTIETTEGTTGQLYEDLRGHTLNFIGKELISAPSVPLAVVESIYTES